VVADAGGDKPYNERRRGDYIVRFFDQSVNEEDLVWHQDHNDRLVQVISSDGWQLQMDDSLPVDLIFGGDYYIPKNTYHRILKGKGTLIVGIKEFY
jgi:hypothetical protein